LFRVLDPSVVDGARRTAVDLCSRDNKQYVNSQKFSAGPASFITEERHD